MKFNRITSHLLVGSEKGIFSNASILGVLGRGTDYASIHPSQHAIVPNSKELINIVDEKYKEWGGGFDYIYLATEDEEILKAFIKHYGRKIISINTTRYETETHNKYITEPLYIADIMKNDTREDRYQKGLDYLKSVYLLSKCDSIITPIVGGASSS